MVLAERAELAFVFLDGKRAMTCRQIGWPLDGGRTAISLLGRLPTES